MTLNHSWLVQRLNAPFPTSKSAAGPFSFGGGLPGGGLSKEALEVLGEIFRFDYMGAAEFEFGAVPEALLKMASAASPKKRKNKLVAFTISIPIASIEKDFRDKSKTGPEGDATVYVLCEKEHVTEVTQRITHWAQERYNSDLKKSTRLAASLRPYSDYDRNVCGWLELDNGFMFFTDEEMWRKTAALFEVEVAE